MNNDYNRIFGDKKRILVVTAHPDDAEIMCGGLICKLTSEGKEVALIVTTNGGKGYQDREDISEREFADLRIKEQEAAAVIMGIKKENNFNLDFPDGEIESSFENIGKIVRHIRRFQPDIVITHNVDDYVVKFDEDTYWVNHRDHRHTGQIVLDAMYPFSRDRGFFPEHFAEGLSQHTVNEVIFLDCYTGDNLVQFEVGEFVDQKTKALSEHKNAIAEDHVEGYIEDFRQEDGSYVEKMKWFKIY